MRGLIRFPHGQSEQPRLGVPTRDPFRRREVGPGEAGFALGAVLLALIALTAIATAGYLRSNTDYRINQNHRASVKAFYVADAARSQFMGRGRVHTDTLTYNYVDGTGQVWLDTLLAVDDSSTLYRLHTVGSHDSPEGGQAARRVNSILLHKVAGFSVNAAITSPPGLLKNGVAGNVDGHDAATPGSCSVAGSEDVAGIALPQSTFTMAGGGVGGGGGPWPPGVDGNPAIDSTQTALQLLLDTGIDWQGILDGSFAQADYLVSQDGYPDFATDVDTDEWPLIVADYSDFAAGPGHSGRGTLAVMGDLDINGNFDWDGLILVGGTLTSNGVETVEGAVITGLNLLLGGSAGQTDLGNGTWLYAYHSCNVLNALGAIGWPVEEPGTWLEVI
jgi:hypothetical protein